MSDPIRQATILSLLLAAAGARSGAVSLTPAVQPASLEQAPADEGVPEFLSPAGPAPSHIGPYRLVRELGSGGMGTVHLAESVEPFARRVALKVIREDLATPDLLARFQAEQRALAAVDHDFVARLYDSGVTAGGRPWFAMEHVEGEPITEYCDRRRLDVDARVRLFVDVCEAVQHLHDRGVIHRDLKPSNILVSERRGRPVPKIIDLGLARLGHSPVGAAEGLVGTPAYMAPELFTLESPEIDARSDLFSLGIVLRELLVGARPGGPGAAGGIHEAVRSLHAGNPAPSAQLSTLPTAASVAHRRSTGVARLRRRLGGALDRILQRASAPRPDARYASAAALGAALERDVRLHEVWLRSSRAFLFLALAAAMGFLGGRIV
jgi:eukaryotic-like serine/threonine-protein kinase